MKSSVPVFGAFGIYRFLLASMVVVSHFGNTHYLGIYAVDGFFVLSGYIVCYILQHQYLTKERGLAKYAVNRFLRVYPAYWVTLALISGLLAYFPAQMHEVAEATSMAAGTGIPHDMFAWLVNLTTFGMLNIIGMWFTPVLLPIAWSLGMEVWYWSMMPLFMTNRRARVIFIIFTFGYTALIAWLSFKHGMLAYVQFRWPNPMAAGLPFCLGMLIFFNKRALPRCYYFAAASAILLLLALPLFVSQIFCYFQAAYYALAVNAAVIYGLAAVDSALWPSLWQRLDKHVGELAYPIFLLHMPVGAGIHILFPRMELENWPSCFIVLGATCFSAILFHVLVEQPINAWRRRIKS